MKKKIAARKAAAKKPAAKKATARKATARKATARKAAPAKKVAAAGETGSVLSGVLRAVRATTDVRPVFAGSTLSSLAISSQVQLGALARNLQKEFPSLDADELLPDLSGDMTVSDVRDLVEEA